MSSAPDSSAEIIHVISSVITQSRISIAAAIVFAYEYVITFDQEVSLFWMRKKTGAT
ncbi:uncharacterized protein TRAVEDRAFT_47253 [Trametes versicolor FP-101664 SS1]|uniref:uncharacterized protein n=1 Tax=Trametes versicolor (strain FP-101664) TaxID=717944 RepID=UPI000462361E|nr:uncharacterized protein TRAVEDRAFT_47253 [Trametes versicolor FP-101664 SS1]EIW59957.1 hypothetical protein TRAVEDRAFT_47253 [Trametes versicolor FP-101664 SS1]